MYAYGILFQCLAMQGRCDDLTNHPNHHHIISEVTTAMYKYYDIYALTAFLIRSQPKKIYVIYNIISNTDIYECGFCFKKL